MVDSHACLEEGRIGFVALSDEEFATRTTEQWVAFYRYIHLFWKGIVAGESLHYYAACSPLFECQTELIVPIYTVEVDEQNQVTVHRKLSV
jgi:hypothetical protein